MILLAIGALVVIVLGLNMWANNACPVPDCHVCKRDKGIKHE